MSDIDDYAYEMAQEDAAEAAEDGAHDEEDPREAQAAYEAEPPYSPAHDEPEAFAVVEVDDPHDDDIDQFGDPLLYQDEPEPSDPYDRPHPLDYL